MTSLRNLAGRMAMAVGLARITATRTDRATERRTLTAQIRMPETGEVRDDTPVLTIYGLASRPRPGADALVVFLGGNRGAGVVVATDDGRFGLPLEEGEVGLVTHEGTKVHLKLGGEIAVQAATRVTIDTPELVVTGRIKANGDIESGAMIKAATDVTIGSRSFNVHRHNENGHGGGTTSEPIG
ncbi:phage baseplate assembly protein domain-containing protein [Roseomonas xinghualingensis]|uniref:phage baseplate assembly protein domain-containing protein n=1 Tax=Roseomonas xinghualingensis TaxID=2986475 RepID=UPI0021F17BA7|nr:phage baseplate assembly protein [Roseomonas sp. SXEYE001]MCV4207577.1 phage baseplate assembly protein [Roseomonas sp. SXEYE001]